MKTTISGESAPDDRMLEWTMRIVGFALAILSLVFLTHDVVNGTGTTYFFSISAGLGIITLIMSWMPKTGEAHLQEQPATRIPGKLQ